MTFATQGRWELFEVYEDHVSRNYMVALFFGESIMYKRTVTKYNVSSMGWEAILDFCIAENRDVNNGTVVSDNEKELCLPGDERC